jgi:hypothetical protein
MAAAVTGSAATVPSSALQAPASLQAPSYAESLKEIFVLREKVRDIHPALANLHPVAVAEGGKLLIFTPDESRRAYVLSATVPEPFPIPKGIRAAFPLNALEGKPACVVTPEIFGEPDGLVFVLHEFVHCTQWVTCETRLKEGLGVYRSAVQRNDGMWEIQHPFPYGDAAFTAAYSRMLQGLRSRDGAAVSEARAALRGSLDPDDLEYMVWQEWKEGWARFLENRVRQRVGLSENRGGEKPPFSRVTFYAGGDRLIESILHGDPGIDMEKTFRVIAGR